MERKKRLICFFAINIVLLLSGIFFILLASFTSGTWLAKFTDCPSHVIFGIYCPLCGGTRALGSLLRGDIISSLIYNPAILPGLIAFAVYDILAFKSILQNKKQIVYIHKWVWIPLFIVVVVNSIVRNVLLIFYDIDYIATMIF